MPAVSRAAPRRYPSGCGLPCRTSSIVRRSGGTIPAVARRARDIDWRDHVRFDEEFTRGASDTRALVGDPSKIREQLGWNSEVRFDELVKMLVDADLTDLKAQTAAGAR